MKTLIRCVIPLLMSAAAGSALAQPTERLFVNGFEEFTRFCGTANTLPCNRIVPEFEGQDDPEGWSVDPDSGIQYRRATKQERIMNGWDPGTFLVNGARLVGSTLGDSRVPVLVPLSDDTTVQVEFEFLRGNAGLSFIRRDVLVGSEVTVRSRKITPTLYEYVQTGFDQENPRPTNGAWAQMLTGTDGGIYMTGMVKDREIAMDGPNPGWHIEDLPGPALAGAPPEDNLVKVTQLVLGAFGEAQFDACAGGFDGCDWLCDASSNIPCDSPPHSNPTAPNHCSDNTDNDNDGTNNSGDEECKDRPDWGDDNHPGFPSRKWESGKSMVLMGEGRFCTQYAGNWIQRLTRVGWDSEALVNGARSFTGLSGDEMALRYLAGGCWVFESLDAANECADGQGCPGGYPYENAGSTASSYYNNVWDDVHHGMFHGLNDAVHVAQTIYWGGTQAQNSRPMNCSALEGSGCCGASVYPAPAGSQGASVVQYEISTGGCNAAHAPVTSAHEFGHNAGLDHDDAWGFMAESSKNSTNLSDFNQDLLMGCLGTFNCPRPSGFRYDP